MKATPPQLNPSLRTSWESARRQDRRWNDSWYDTWNHSLANGIDSTIEVGKKVPELSRGIADGAHDMLLYSGPAAVALLQHIVCYDMAPRQWTWEANPATRMMTVVNQGFYGSIDIVTVHAAHSIFGITTNYNTPAPQSLYDWGKELFIGATIAADFALGKMLVAKVKSGPKVMGVPEEISPAVVKSVSTPKPKNQLVMIDEFPSGSNVITPEASADIHNIAFPADKGLKYVLVETPEGFELRLAPKHHQHGDLVRVAMNEETLAMTTDGKVVGAGYLKPRPDQPGIFDIDGGSQRLPTTDHAVDPEMSLRFFDTHDMTIADVVAGKAGLVQTMKVLSEQFELKIARAGQEWLKNSTVTRRPYRQPHTREASYVGPHPQSGLSEEALKQLVSIRIGH